LDTNYEVVVKVYEMKPFMLGFYRKALKESLKGSITGTNLKDLEGKLTKD
jgi:protein required for attachment to host cells